MKYRTEKQKITLDTVMSLYLALAVLHWVGTRNTFYETRYLSHCCVLFCIKTCFL